MCDGVVNRRFGRGTDSRHAANARRCLRRRVPDGVCRLIRRKATYSREALLGHRAIERSDCDTRGCRRGPLTRGVDDVRPQPTDRSADDFCRDASLQSFGSLCTLVKGPSRHVGNVTKISHSNESSCCMDDASHVQTIANEEAQPGFVTIAPPPGLHKIKGRAESHQSYLGWPVAISQKELYTYVFPFRCSPVSDPLQPDAAHDLSGPNECVFARRRNFPNSNRTHNDCPQYTVQGNEEAMQLIQDCTSMVDLSGQHSPAASAVFGHSRAASERRTARPPAGDINEIDVCGLRPALLNLTSDLLKHLVVLVGRNNRTGCALGSSWASTQPWVSIGIVQKSLQSPYAFSAQLLSGGCFCNFFVFATSF